MNKYKKIINLRLPNQRIVVLEPVDVDQRGGSSAITRGQAGGSGQGEGVVKGAKGGLVSSVGGDCPDGVDGADGGDGGDRGDAGVGGYEISDSQDSLFYNISSQPN